MGIDLIPLLGEIASSYVRLDLLTYMRGLIDATHNPVHVILPSPFALQHETLFSME